VKQLSGVFLLGLTGCVEDGPTMHKVKEAWASETAVQAGPSVTATLVLAAVTAELCTRQGEGIWDNVETGDVLPVAESLNASLAYPEITDLVVRSEDSVEFTVEQTHIFDRDEALVQGTVTPGTEYFLVEFMVSPGTAGDGPGSAVATVSLHASPDCEATGTWVQGSAAWKDLDQKTHTVSLPPSDQETEGVELVRNSAFVPEEGTLGWSGQMRGEAREWISDTAEQLEVEGDTGGTDSDTGFDRILPTAAWPGTASGDSWKSAVSITVGL
jgi:hypothetical protein